MSRVPVQKKSRAQAASKKAEAAANAAKAKEDAEEKNLEDSPGARGRSRHPSIRPSFLGFEVSFQDFGVDSRDSLCLRILNTIP